MSRAVVVVLAVVLVPLPARAQASRADEVYVEVGRLSARVLAVEALLLRREERLESLAREIKTMAEDAQASRALPTSLPVAGPFLSSPPLSSDSVGVAKVAVFAPKLEVDSSRRHDTVFFKVRRLEPDSAKLIAETELGQDQTGTDVPIDRSGGLYVVEWTTAEGHSYNLLLRDGASGQTAAQVLVKPLQAQGRFLFVGYRLE